MLGFEFLALINILIYVGALAVLFLFVIMLIEVPTTELRAYYRGSSVLGLLSYVGVVGLFNVRHDWQGSMTCGADVTGADVTGADVTGTGGAGYILCPTQESIMQIGYAFYIQYADILILNSLVLTIALFGALVLAHTRS
jgi:NADH:ubiquinone oxidoreductase subunit 6 (subunit J)